MKRPLFHLLFVTAGLLCLAQRPTAQGQLPIAGPMFFEGARLIIGDGSAPIENSAFAVENGRFTRVGRRGDVQPPPGATRIDLTGKTVTPAFIDVHDHVGGTRDGYIDKLKLLAYCGIAVATSMGTDNENVWAVRSEYFPDAAEILTSGRGMVGPVGITPVTIAAGEYGRLPEDRNLSALSVVSESQARLHVRELAQQRADFIKVWITDRGGLEQPMADNVYKALLDEAHKHHLKVYSDSWKLQTYKDLVRAGIDGFAHPIRDQEVDDEFMQLVKDHRNVLMNTNLNGTEIWRHTTDPAYFSDPLLHDLATPAQIKRLSDQIRGNDIIMMQVHEGWDTVCDAKTGCKAHTPRAEFVTQRYNIMTRNTAKLYKAGVVYGVGPDGGGAPSGYSYHLEMKLLVQDVGLTPMQVLTMATLQGARAMELDRRLGSVESGKDASFVVLDANPLDDITNTQRISRVYLLGHEVDRAGYKKAHTPQASN